MKNVINKQYNPKLSSSPTQSTSIIKTLSKSISISGSPTASMSSFTPPSPSLLLLTTGISPSTQINDDSQQQIIHANINNITSQNIINVDSNSHENIFQVKSTKV
jgi:hypothetical protein